MNTGTGADKVKETKTYCDICKKLIAQGCGVDKGTIKLSGPCSAKNTICKTLYYQDVCRRCMVALFKTVANMEKKYEK
jgi:hypothetical protein